MQASEVIETHLAELLELPRDIRLELGERLIESAFGERDPDVRRAWEQELDSRVRDVEAGTADLAPVEDMLQRAWEEVHAIARQAPQGGTGND